MSTDDALIQIGESTAAAVTGVLAMFVGDGVVQGPVAVVPPGAHPMEGVPTPSIASDVAYVDGVTGGNVFVMTVKGARRLAASMMGEPLPEEEDGDLSELEASAMGEAMNQMMSAGAVATSAALGKEVEIAPPDVKRLETDAEALAAYEQTPHAVTVHFSVLGEPCRLVQLIPNAFVVRMTRALDELTTEYTSAPLSKSVRSVPLRLWAELGRASMPLSRIVGLPAGAVVELDHDVEEPIELFVDDMPFATGRLMVTDENEWAVRIETVHGLPSPNPQPQGV